MHPATRRLYVFMDVTFIKDEIFFSDTPKHVLQGETSSEGHSWLDLQASLIVPDQAPLDNPKVSASIHTADNSYVLLPRQNRGVPPDHYSPEGKARYAIAHYVTDHMLSPECKAFVARMDSIKISTRVEEASNDPKWVEAMNIEMEALQKNNTCDIVDLPKAGKVTLLIIYVDDMIVIGDDTAKIEELQKCLAFEFEIKELGSLKYFLGVKVTRSKHGFFLSQRKYVMDLLANTGMIDCKLADTPIVENHKLGVYVDQVLTNKERYQRLVRIFIYLSLTRLDIAYAVSVASQFMRSPSDDHMAAVMRILSYLKFAPGRDRHSTSGYFTFVGGNLVTWCSKKQNVVSRSFAKFEYRGIAQGVCEIQWLRWLLAEIGFRPDAASKL
ncbi:hypothetical protein L3X38_027846 [Prunus dulcis]|uniref:Reverse transcriptase Ty1/copia-type domain-containing protein n=1 Tax=Prunus dulcis TaxID=3755 RepID=A0AAD4Z0U9_PRUDU|nr:hypothetical protein L3X38_027846 [Prunus dulcis]